jgi:PhzF family phenazine biosynthesis protein
MKTTVYTLNAFAAAENGGNPAGVVLNADDLNEAQMLKIAQEVGFSETAFVQKSSKADFRVRFFTTVGEIDLCGHATIATFFLLKEKGVVTPGKYTQETLAGILDIEISQEGNVLMNQPLPQYFGTLDKQEIADVIDLPLEEIADDLPIEMVSTGVKNVFIPLKKLSTLLELELDYEKVAPVTKKHGGFHLFSLETLFEDSTAHCRNIAPHNGIAEESATGTASGAISCYLFKHNKLSADQAKNITIEQGYCMEMPSEIFVSLGTQDNEISSVQVGGAGMNIEEMEVEV